MGRRKLYLKLILESYFTVNLKDFSQVEILKVELKFPFEKATKTTLIQIIDCLVNKSPFVLWNS